MSRRIVCRKCGSTESWRPLHPEDVAMGFQQRFVTGKARKPAVHEIKTYVGGRLTNTEHLATIRCDHCGAAIRDGEKCVAISMWRDGQMGDWESEFMDVDV